MPSSCEKLVLRVGARSSPLSQAQLKEVLGLIRQFHLEVDFDPVLVDSTGDIRQDISLRALGKTDFFTREIDEMLLKGECRIAIHSAKDLPDPLPKGLKIIALTKGLDSSDSLVLRPNETLESLPSGAKIATSSERREECVSRLRSDLSFMDLRGTIAKRLAKLENGEADGVVVAEAALIRLDLTHLNRVRLPGDTTLHQGRLAIVAKEDDKEIEEIFRPLHHIKTLYTGLDSEKIKLYADVVHCPLIQILPRNPQAEDIQKTLNDYNLFTHLIFTSKSSVEIFSQIFPHPHQTIIAVGKATAKALKDKNIPVHSVASEETSEGIISVLEQINLEGAHVLWPHSSLSRTVIPSYLETQNIPFQDCILYETKTVSSQPQIRLNEYDEIVFTSPSTINAFIELFGKLPCDKTFTCIGPVTEKHLRSCTNNAHDSELQ